GIRDGHVTGVQTCALPIYSGDSGCSARSNRTSDGRRTCELLIESSLRIAQLPALGAAADRDARERAAEHDARSRERRGGGEREQIGRASCRERVKRGGRAA